MTGKVSAIDYKQPTSTTSCQGYVLEFNCYHVSISASIPKTGAPGPTIYQRKPAEDNWMDDSHRRITKAIEELDAAILAAAQGVAAVAA